MPFWDGPSITLQYDPAGKPVANVVVHAVSILLIATKPSEPAKHLYMSKDILPRLNEEEVVASYRGQMQSAGTTARSSQ